MGGISSDWHLLDFIGVYIILIREITEIPKGDKVTEFTELTS
jgi:hypothetical protein